MILMYFCCHLSRRGVNGNSFAMRCFSLLYRHLSRRGVNGNSSSSRSSVSSTSPLTQRCEWKRQITDCTTIRAVSPLTQRCEWKQTYHTTIVKSIGHLSRRGGNRNKQFEQSIKTLQSPLAQRCE